MKGIFLGLVLAASSVFADAAPAPARENNLTQTLMMIGVAVIFFYFIMWRPEQKRRKAIEQQRSSIKKGDRATAMGILGTVVRVQDDTIILKMVDGSKIEVLKAVISNVQPGSEEEAKVEVQTVETSDVR
jgi:preprotein translocase subunit YajC